jgi:hypothetical protein
MNDRAPERRPTRVLVRCKSGWIIGARKLDAFRSNSTNPKFRLMSEVRMIW